MDGVGQTVRLSQRKVRAADTAGRLKDRTAATGRILNIKGGISANSGMSVRLLRKATVARTDGAPCCLFVDQL